MVRFDILTIFPKQISNFASEGIFRIAEKKKLVKIVSHNLRDWTTDNHKTVDDRPFGGGAGMVLMVEPIYKAVKSIKSLGRGYKKIVIMTTPSGEKMTQKLLRGYASSILRNDNKKNITTSITKKTSKKDPTKNTQFIILCGHYEGFDERIREILVDREISIGDFVLSGGEIPALAFIDGLIRLIPGVLGNESSPVEESFENGLLEYPQYTRPAIFKGRKVPEILLSGNHKEIEQWRKSKAIELTDSRRKDLRRE